MENDWQSYNVHWKDGERKGKTCISALSKEDARTVAEKYMCVDAPNGFPFEGKVTKVIGPLGKPASPKQKLAQSYGFIAGSLKGAELQFRKSLEHMQSSDPKVTASRGLVNSQFAKLQRDLRDCFKRAGLNVK